MRGEAAEQLGGDDLRADPPADLGGVVEHGSQRHPSQELEHVPEPLADALGGLAPEHLRQPDVGVRERHHEEVAAPRDAARAGVRLPEVDLALAGQPVEQQEPPLPAGVELGRQLLPPPPHVPLHGGAGALEAPLLDEPVVDPPGRVALLVPAAPVLQEPRVDQLREGPGQGRLGRPPTAGGLSERSGSLRRFLTVGSETPVSRAIEATLAPLRPSLLISPILAAPIISFLASNRRNRSSDNVRPNGMVGVPALRPETLSRSFPKLHRAQTRKAEAIKHTWSGMSACLASKAATPGTPRAWAAPSSYETVLDASHDPQRHLCAPAAVLPFLRIAAPQHGHLALFIEPFRPRDLTARFSGARLRGRRSGQHAFCPGAKNGARDLSAWETAAHLGGRPFRQHTFIHVDYSDMSFYLETKTEDLT